ncbi:hypothetical protein DPMN_137442 [Dreissena polymorpha]|uniref:Uncharacterized protein n=1 Tax=Dreissena polymorpha TaxID=45954 RepID=A0A9D4G1U5_DREPO|nr:hypothetical protein DPMN_137442 [Dreissena polymorpha]
MDSEDERRDRIVGEDRADNVNGHTERPRGSVHEGRALCGIGKNCLTCLVHLEATLIHSCHR